MAAPIAEADKKPAGWRVFYFMLLISCGYCAAGPCYYAVAHQA
jgi:hypothetical protein